MEPLPLCWPASRSTRLPQVSAAPLPYLRVHAAIDPRALAKRVPSPDAVDDPVDQLIGDGAPLDAGAVYERPALGRYFVRDTEQRSPEISYDRDLQHRLRTASDSYTAVTPDQNS